MALDQQRQIADDLTGSSPQLVPSQLVITIVDAKLSLDKLKNGESSERSLVYRGVC